MRTNRTIAKEFTRPFQCGYPHPEDTGAGKGVYGPGWYKWIEGKFATTLVKFDPEPSDAFAGVDEVREAD